MSPEAIIGVVFSSVFTVLLGALVKRQGESRDLLQKLDTRGAVFEEQMKATHARVDGIDRRIAEVEGDLDVIRLDHARNHGHEYATQTRPGLIPANARNIR